jgi:hypothetical protein
VNQDQPSGTIRSSRTADGVVRSGDYEDYQSDDVLSLREASGILCKTPLVTPSYVSTIEKSYESAQCRSMHGTICSIILVQHQRATSLPMAEKGLPLPRSEGGE